MKQKEYKKEVLLAKRIIKILDKKAKQGCNNPSWIGFENGNGTEVGKDIERLIKNAKKILRNES